MDWSKFLSKEILLQIAKMVFEKLIYPEAEKYVRETSNPYDDIALQFLKDFVNNKLLK